MTVHTSHRGGMSGNDLGGTVPPTPAVPDEQRRLAARVAVTVAARCGGTRDETFEFLGALGLLDQIPALRQSTPNAPYASRSEEIPAAQP